MRYVALLRAINVGGHTVKMPVLKKAFEDLGFDDVATFIASGNVIFDGGKAKGATLEKKIEKHLEAELGYEVKTFLRTIPELEAVIEAAPFEEGQGVVYIGFMQDKPAASAIKNLVNAATEVDDFAVKGREVYWHARAGFSDTLFRGNVEKILGQPTTLRNTNTIRRLIDKYATD